MNYIARGCMYCEGICNKECLPKQETLEEDDQTLAEIKERMKTRELEKTAVEWLIDWMKANQYSIGSDLLEAAHTAKAMEYFQNKKMYERGAEDFVKKVNQLSKPSSNEQCICKL